MNILSSSFNVFFVATFLRRKWIIFFLFYSSSWLLPCEELIDGELKYLDCFMYGSVLELNMTVLVHVNRTFSALLYFSSKPAYNSAEHRDYGFKFSLRFNMAATFVWLLHACFCFLVETWQSVRGFDFWSASKETLTVQKLSPYLQLL